ncbi:iron ABC transporter permease [Butyrivibrio sp. XB500-5]|uniref:ABC transporter permease n=1 Tax=Butyrivibrio sp. XB500-5 TaxID=2364880 RepID=UPI000EA84A82|nr:iron ABC transporter permease [Butyrivibrio sp. XB500-5]RKM61716.1 iron ABC transporter permease [Butyrivibrio sp. XB500-5]
MKLINLEKIKNRIKTYFSNPANCMLVFFFIVFLGLSIYPITAMIKEMFIVHAGIEKTLISAKKGSFTLYHIQKLFTPGEWSVTSFYIPFKNSFLLGFFGASLAIIFGGVTAWLMTRSNLKYKKLIGTLFMFPYLMPAWTLAQFWIYLFQNTNVMSGNKGIVQSLFGLCMPQWFVYGLFPCVIVNSLHFAPFAYILIGGILQNMDATLEESAQILRANRLRIVRKVTLPIVMPALLSTFLLVFSSGFASYAVPVFLGGAVRFYTLASKMKAMINAGYMGQAYIIAAVMILCGIIILMINQRYTNKRRSFTTVTGKSGQVSLVDLKKANGPISIAMIVLTVCFSVVPLIVFALQTIQRIPGDYSISNWTLDFWIGKDLDAYKMGMVGGILVGKDFLMALFRLVLLSIACSVFAGTAGLFIGYSVVRNRRTKLSKMVEAMSFFPYLIPTIAFSAIYLALASTKTFSFLYNSFLLLVIVGGVKYLPFASRGCINSMLQVSAEIEEAAILMKVPWYKRIFRILVPIQKTSIFSGYLLPIVSAMREVDLFALIVSNSSYMLTTMLLAFNQTGYDQYASAITLLIIVIVLVINQVSSKLTGASISQSVGSYNKQ